MIRQIALLVFLRYALAFPEASNQARRNTVETPLVTTPLGQIKGAVLTSRLGKSIYSFRGIRYAKAPLPKGTEKPKRPVIFHIHAGGFYSVGSASYWAGPQYFMDQDIVLVTFNYRLGTLGSTSFAKNRRTLNNYINKANIKIYSELQLNNQNNANVTFLNINSLLNCSQFIFTSGLNIKYSGKVTVLNYVTKLILDEIPENQEKAIRKNSVVVLNSQSLLSKYDEISNLILTFKPLIVCLGETRLIEDINDNEINIFGYNILRVDSCNRHTGGVLMYLRKDVKILKFDKISYLKNYWLLSVKISFNKKNFVIVTLYHSPSSSDLDFMNMFEQWCEQNITDISCPVLIVGDFNINWLSNTTYASRLKNFISDIGLNQLVDRITHPTETAGSIIDLVFTNTDKFKCRVHETPRISDHYILSLNLYFNNETKINKVIYSRGKIDYIQMNEKLTLINWNFHHNSIDDKYISIYNNIKNILDDVAPRKEVVIKPKFKEWWNEIVKNAVVERDTSYKIYSISKSTIDKQAYKKSRNNVVKIIRQEKTLYYQNKIDYSKNDPKKMWQALQPLIKDTQDKEINKLKIDEEIITNVEEIPNSLNVFYINSIEEVISKIDTTNCSIDNRDGLFHKAVAMSGSVFGNWPIPHNQLDVAKKQAKFVGCPDDTAANIVKCLKTKPFNELGESLPKFKEFGNDPVLIWSPVIEADFGQPRFLPAHPIQMIINGQFKKVPFITGQTTDEFGHRAFNVVNNETLTKEINSNFDKIAPIAFLYDRDTDHSKTISESFRSFYLHDKPVDKSQLAPLAQLYADSTVGFAVNRAAKLIAEHSNASVFYYKFSYQGRFSHFYTPESNNSSPYGKYLPPLIVNVRPLAYGTGTSCIFLVVLRTNSSQCFYDVVTLFIIIIMNPIPTPSEKLDNVKWEPFTIKDQKYLDIGNKLVMNEKLYEKRYAEWEKLFPLGQYTKHKQSH
ncbi:hypothetical protein NQ314_020227 [Rhamnusium bicolor]|uniref:Endonuclease/exonuclease/phosphatase domain-containing protein n=1 Tax=Rhamnusium bicolor TaxID=1586634 RepID=A0AAV8WLP4_9CUCU|nr:hypothetical protein NQ314_020227 [Rhamnusium bicolor]